MEGAEERGPPRRRRGRELRFICETRTHPSAKAEAEAATKRGSERREREERERENGGPSANGVSVARGTALGGHLR